MKIMRGLLCVVLCVLASVQVVGADLRESANSELNALAPQRKVSPKKTGKGVKKQLAEGQGRVTAKSVKATYRSTVGICSLWRQQEPRLHVQRQQRRGRRGVA